MKSARRAAVLAAVAMLATGLLAGCSNNAPQLSAEQLQAGVIPMQHPVSQQEATQRGCECHTQQQ